MSATNIEPKLRLSGEIVAGEDLRVAGELAGSLSAEGRSVTLEETSIVHATIAARDVVVRGVLQGDVRAAGRLEIGGTARVTGHLSAARVPFAEGASLVGSVRLNEPVSNGTLSDAPSGELRASAALKAFLDTLTAIPHARLLDLGAVSQGSVDHFVGPGHVLFFEDLLPAARAAHEAGVPAAELLAKRLAHPDAHFDAVLCWDVLSFAPPEYLAEIVERLHAAMRPGAVALAFFPAAPATAPGPPGRFEVFGPGGVLRRRPSSGRGEARFLTRRELERQLGRSFRTRDFLTQGGVHELLLFRRD
jgi:cytoskeletal protein CcmA (bactofilin family)